MSDSASEVMATRNTGTAGMLIAVGLGAMVAVALGVFGRVHEPQFFSINVAGFSSGTAVKSWLGTLAVLLALFQLFSAFVMYRLTPGGRAPAWIAAAHVWSGRLAVLATVPVAVHCLYALGFADTDATDGRGFQGIFCHLHSRRVHGARRGGRHHQLSLPRQQVQPRRHGGQRTGNSFFGVETCSIARRFDHPELTHVRST